VTISRFGCDEGQVVSTDGEVEEWINRKGRSTIRDGWSA